VNRSRLVLALLAAAALGAASPAAADEVDPRALLDRAFANLYADDYVQTLELTTQYVGLRPVVRTLQIVRKQSIRPGKALVRFLEPPDVRRTSVLILENETANDDLWVYLPALRMTRRISASQRADAFFGTDLSYEDVEPKHAADYDVSLAPPAPDGSGCVALEIRARPSFESTYDAMRSCIEPERALILWTDFVRAGKVVKRLRMDPAAVRPIGKRFIPFSISMETLRTRSHTEVRTLDYELVNVPEKVFTTWNLEAGSADKDRKQSEAQPAR
jgi:hypothetical protein